MDGLKEVVINEMLMIPGGTLGRAEQELKGVEDGKLLLKALNGSGLYIKEAGVVRDSTQDEWRDFANAYNAEKDKRDGNNTNS